MKSLEETKQKRGEKLSVDYVIVAEGGKRSTAQDDAALKKELGSAGKHEKVAVKTIFTLSGN